MSSPQMYSSGFKSDIRFTKRRVVFSVFAVIAITNSCTFILMTQFWHVPTCEFHFSNLQEAETTRQWHAECPEIGGGPRGVVVTVVPGGRLGNHVFEYLSVWALARRYNVWPAVPKLVLQTLYEGAFTSLVIPSLEDLVKRCNLSYLLKDMRNIGEAGNIDDLFEAMKFENSKPVSIIVLKIYAIKTEYIIPYWIELSEKMMFQNKYLISSQTELQKVTEEIKSRRIKDNASGSFASTSDIQYVAVHVRRTDYMEYLKRKFGAGAKPAASEFFFRAMEEMRRRLKPRPMIFVVVSDDPQWCRENLHGPDVIVAGNGDISSPGHDLALLAACNHTIMAYGTFGLTASMHNKNGITITYNTKLDNGTTAAMSFATRLPNWPQEHETARQWHDECPATGGGPRGAVVTVVPGGRLGNQVFEYLAVWTVARRYNVWPAVPKLMLQKLQRGAFTSFIIPSIEDLVKRCNLTYLLEDMRKIGDDGNKKDIFEAMKFENNKPVSIIVLRKYMIEMDYIIPYWVELSDNIIFQNKYLGSSQTELLKVTEEMKRRALFNESDSFASTADIQYVAVHVRRTDYMRYLKHQFGSSAKPAESDFFFRAMEEIRRRLKPRPIIFVVVSDDPQWCRENLHGPDVIVAGNGDIKSPGHDLALLAACNHTIMAYGTFGLTVAIYNKNGITITYNTKSDNGSTSAMSFATRLPNWMIL